jgi:hypothetical protein
MPKATVTKDDVKALLNTCVLMRSAYEHYRALFEPGNPYDGIFRTLAPIFFGDINLI